MIYEYPIDGPVPSADELLGRTAEQAKLLMPVVYAVVDDIAERLKIQAETLDEQSKKVSAYLKYRLTMQRKALTAVTDQLEAALENRLTEQQVLLNYVAPGITDYLEQSPTVDAAASAGESLQSIPLVDDAGVPLPPVPDAIAPGQPEPTAGNGSGYNSQAVYPQPTAIGVDSGQSQPVSVDQTQVKPSLIPPQVSYSSGIVIQTYANGIQITANANVVPGELQVFSPVGGNPIAIPIVVPQDLIPYLPSGGQIAIVLQGNNPQAAISAAPQGVNVNDATGQPTATVPYLAGQDSGSPNQSAAGYDFARPVQADVGSVQSMPQQMPGGNQGSGGTGNGVGIGDGSSWVSGPGGSGLFNRTQSGGLGGTGPQPTAGSGPDLPGSNQGGSSNQAAVSGSQQCGPGPVCVMVQGIPCDNNGSPLGGIGISGVPVIEPEGEVLVEELPTFDDPDDWDY